MARKPSDKSDLYSRNVIRIRILQTVLDDADEIKKTRVEYQHMQKQNFYAYLLARGLQTVKDDLRHEGRLTDGVQDESQNGEDLDRDER